MKEFSESDKVLMAAVGHAFKRLTDHASPQASEEVIAMILKSVDAVYPNGFERQYPLVGQDEDTKLS